jgi:hypothetical protein
MRMSKQQFVEKFQMTEFRLTHSMKKYCSVDVMTDVCGWKTVKRNKLVYVWIFLRIKIEIVKKKPLPALLLLSSLSPPSFPRFGCPLFGCRALPCVVSHVTRRNCSCWHPNLRALPFLEKKIMFLGGDVNMHNALALRTKHAHLLKVVAFVLG